MNTELNPAYHAAARRDPQGWSTACELIRVGAGEEVFDLRLTQLESTLRQTQALLKALCLVMVDSPESFELNEILELAIMARDMLSGVGDDPLGFVEDFAIGAREVVYEQAVRVASLSSAPHVAMPPTRAEMKDVLTQAIKDALEKEGACGSGSKPKRAGKGKAAVEGKA